MYRHSMFIRFCFVFILFIGCASHKGQLDLRYTTIRGNEDAETEVIVFSDFQCPFCKKVARELENAYKKLPSKLKIHFKHFPLSYHPQALNAAKAAEAARLQGKFWEMHDLLFANNGNLQNSIYAELAKQVGLDTEQFLRDMSSFETARRVSADRAEGHSIGVNAVPFILIDGVRHIGLNSDLKEAIIRVSTYK
jgi:protein-disulfide isomerase